MQRVLITVFLVLVASTLALATVVGTKHDLTAATGTGTAALQATNTTEVCVFCHTPHQAAAASAQDPLWNHTLSGQGTYGVYTSATSDFVPTDIGGATAGSANVSNLCMSCHDGTIGVGSLYNDPNSGTPDNSADAIPPSNPAYVGIDLTNDHPINFDYTAAASSVDSEINDAADYPNYVDAANGNVPLFNGSVQCASCHDPHDATFTPFLVVTNGGSALCRTCHLK